MCIPWHGWRRRGSLPRRSLGFSATLHCVEEDRNYCSVIFQAFNLSEGWYELTRRTLELQVFLPPKIPKMNGNVYIYREFSWALGEFRLIFLLDLGLGLGSFARWALTHYFFGLIFTSKAWIGLDIRKLDYPNSIKLWYHRFVVMTWRNLIGQFFLFNKCPLSRFVHLYGGRI